MKSGQGLLFLACCGFFLVNAGFAIRLDSKFVAETVRIRRNAPGQPNLGYGGGVSMSLEVNPYNTRDPVNFADSVQFGYGLNDGSIKGGKTIGSTNVIGNGVAGGNNFGGAGHGRGFGGGNANTAAFGSPGYGMADTTNMAFDGTSGNGAGHGGATGQARGG